MLTSWADAAKTTSRRFLELLKIYFSNRYFYQKLPFYGVSVPSGFLPYTFWTSLFPGTILLGCWWIFLPVTLLLLVLFAASPSSLIAICARFDALLVLQEIPGWRFIVLTKKLPLWVTGRISFYLLLFIFRSSFCSLCWWTRLHFATGTTGL